MLKRLLRAGVWNPPGRQRFFAPSLPTLSRTFVQEETLRTTLVLWYGRDFKWSGEYDGLPLSALGDMVVMVPNYRLHLLGFLGDGTDDAPGNVAFEDQRLASISNIFACGVSVATCSYI